MRISVRRRRKPRLANSEFGSYARLVADPCYGPLTRSVSESSPGAVLERVRTSVTLSSTETAGYVVMFPSYHGRGPNPYSSNSIFYYATSNTTTQPINTAALPLGLAAAITTGLFVTDPAYNVLGITSPFSRAKTLSSCLQLEYLGALSALSGQVAVISNLSFSMFNANVGTGGLQAPSVDTLFGYAAERERFQLDGHEGVWRPNDKQCVMRTNSTENAGSASVGVEADACFWSGSTAVTATTSACVDPGDVYGVAIAWRGIPATANTITFNVVKCLELELAMRSGQIESIPRPITNKRTVDEVTSYLDSIMPNWQRHGISAMSEITKQLARAWAPRFGANLRASIVGTNRLSIMDGEL